MQHCSCEAGFHMSGTAENSICQAQPCNDAFCSCRNVMSVSFLADVNECEIYKLEGAPRLCMHACINTPGSYHCSCPPGYKLFNNGKNCEGDRFPFTKHGTNGIL
ncbi:hypothetical protein Chor_006192 [Crotalus horridus]